MLRQRNPAGLKPALPRILERRQIKPTQPADVAVDEQAVGPAVGSPIVLKILKATATTATYY